MEKIYSVCMPQDLRRNIRIEEHTIDSLESRKTTRCRRSFSVLLLFLPLFFLLPETSPAQQTFVVESGQWEASLFLGGSFLGSGSHKTPIEGSGGSRIVRLKYDSGFQMGAGIMNNHWRHVSAALEYRYSDQSVTFTNLSDFLPSFKVGHSVHRFTYDILYFPLGRDVRFQPYAFGGPGLSLFYVHGSGKDAAAAQGLQLNDPWKFTMNWGGGGRFFLNRRIAASFQFSDNITGVPGYGLPLAGLMTDAGYIPGFRPNGRLHGWEIRGGIMFHLREQ